MTAAEDPVVTENAGTPEERIEAAFDDLNSALRAELLIQITDNISSDQAPDELRNRSIAAFLGLGISDALGIHYG